MLLWPESVLPPRIWPVWFFQTGFNPKTQHAMQQIKIFKGLESNLALLEKEVNGWLAQSGARVVQMFGNLAAQSGQRNETNSLAAYPYVASDVLLVVLYEPKE